MYNCIRSMKKVLIVFNHPAPYKVRLFNELSKYFELHVIFERTTSKDRQKGFYFEHEYNFKLHKIKGIHLGKENFLSGGIIKHIKENDYDLIIMNGYSTFAEMKTINFLKRTNKKYSLYINGGQIPSRESKLKQKIKTHFIKGAESYFSPDEISNKYLMHYGAPEKSIFNYPYSTIFESEILKSKVNKAEQKEKLGINFDHFYVSSGQLIKRKNYLNLVKAWQKMPENYGIFIFGEGKQHRKISRIIQTNNIKNVVLKGFAPRKEMLQYFALADAFVFPSKEDIYGHVINEALSQGLPVVSSKHVNSAIKLIDKKEIGILLDEINNESIFYALNELSKIDSFESCIAKSKENTIEKMAKKHVEIFEEILKK